MGNYVAYLRQSTTKQEKSGLGIEAQRNIIHSFVKEGLIIAEFVETESGKSQTALNYKKHWLCAEKQILSLLWRNLTD